MRTRSAGRFQLSSEFLTRYGIWLVILSAFAIHFYMLDVRTFHGDELGSLGDANDLRKNLQAISYFVFLQAWMRVGTSEFWLRSLSALFATAAVAILFSMARVWWNKEVALLASLLLATAPFAQVYAQQIRFYALFLLASSLNLYTFFIFLKYPSRRQWLFWLIASLALVTTHAMAFLLISLQVLALFLFTDCWSVKQKLSALGILVFLAVVVVVSPLSAAMFNLLAVYTDAQAVFTFSRGLSLAQIAKIPLTFFVFVVGESVYPLNFLLVLPALLLYATAFLIGVWRLRKQTMLLVFLGLASVASPIHLYLLFDALIPPTFGGAAPRYLIFLLPLFYLVVAAGAQGKQTWLIVPLLFVNVGSLVSYWYGDWAYTDDLVNWRTVSKWASEYVTPQTLVLVDGRSEGLANRYLPATWDKQNLWNYQSPATVARIAYPRVLVFSSDFHLDKRRETSQVLEQLAERYDATAVWSQYPVFVYVFDQKSNRSNGYRGDASTGNLNLPLEIFGLEFQDVRLPISLSVDGRVVPSIGAFALPGLESQTTRVIPLAVPTSAQKIWLQSNVTGANLPEGTVLGELIVTRADGTTFAFPLRAGIETSAWNSQCRSVACRPAFTWRKRLALLGAERYLESWQEFDASIFSSELRFDAPTVIQSLELRRTNSAGTWHVWGLVIE